MTTTISPPPAPGRRARLLALVLLTAAFACVQLYYYNDVAWALRLAWVIVLVYMALRLLLDLARVGVNFLANTVLQREYVRQEREKTGEHQLTRLKTQAELRQAEASALKAQNEAQYSYIVADKDQAVFVRDLSKNTVWRPLHLLPQHRVNGVQQPPNGVELATWQIWQQAGGTNGRPVAAPDSSLSLAAGTALPQRIALQDLLLNGRGNLRNIILGVRVDRSGQLAPLSAPIWRLVHIALGGVTDSGKSNLSRAIAYQVLTASGPVECIMADLKRQTFKPFKNYDRLRYPIITDETDFAAVLHELDAETQRRFRLFEPHPQVETLADYHRLAEEELPYIVVFVDEIAGILNGNDIQKLFLQLILVSRAAGIFFVSAGQRWSHKIIDTTIRDQFRTRLHFATNDPHSSKMLLDSAQASEIELQGRAYAQLPFGIEREIVEVQTPLLELEQAASPPIGAIEGGLTVPEHTGPQPIPDLPPPVPDTDESRVMELHSNGESRSAIAREVFKHDGGNQLKLVDEILKKYQVAAP